MDWEEVTGWIDGDPEVGVGEVVAAAMGGWNRGLKFRVRGYI